MGYYTDYRLTPSAGSFIFGEILFDAIQNFMQDKKDSYLWDAWNGDAIGVTWYEHQEDMIELSAAFPDVLFTLWGHGEEEDDHWGEYYLDGKCQVTRGEIIYPDFDKSQLRSLNSRECPYCYGEGVLHADGYGSIGCPKCNGAGEVFDG